MPMLKKTLTTVVLSASFLLLSPIAHAQASDGWFSRVRSWWNDLAKWQSGGGSGRAVPELDPGTAAAALLLLLLGVAYIASRRRAEKHEG